MSAPTADVSVRVAWADDAPAIAALQVRTWSRVYAELAPAASLPQDPAQLEPVWRAALVRPQDARNRVLVALERNRVVGFVLTSPALDPDCDPVSDGEVSELTLEVDERGKGHGSRLLQAAVDTLVADRFSRAVAWATSTDDELRTFLTQAGWAPDGAHRELAVDDAGTHQVKQVRLHTSIGAV